MFRSPIADFRYHFYRLLPPQHRHRLEVDGWARRDERGQQGRDGQHKTGHVVDYQKAPIQAMIPAPQQSHARRGVAVQPCTLRNRSCPLPFRRPCVRGKAHDLGLARARGGLPFAVGIGSVYAIYTGPCGGDVEAAALRPGRGFVRLSMERDAQQTRTGRAGAARPNLIDNQQGSRSFHAFGWFRPGRVTS